MACVNTAIALIDCNNFFVSCERLFRPDLVGKPVVVLSSNDGCVISRSDEAKVLGFKMGEPYFRVRELCDARGVAVFSSNFDLYRDLSRRVMTTLRRFSDEVEVYSVDEAFLTVDASRLPRPEPHGVVRRAVEWGVEVRGTVLCEVGIPVSVGIAPTKTLAKVATHYAKHSVYGCPVSRVHEGIEHNGVVEHESHARPGRGVCVLMDEVSRARALEHLPIEEVWGVGFRLAPTLRALGIDTAGKLVAKDDAWVRKRMSVCGLRTVHELRGTMCFQVGESREIRKTLLHSRSFGKPVRDLFALRAAVAYHARKVAETLRREHVVAR